MAKDLFFPAGASSVGACHWASRPFRRRGPTVRDAELLMLVGYRVANTERMPEWKPGNEFKARRDAMLKK